MKREVIHIHRARKTDLANGILRRPFVEDFCTPIIKKMNKKKGEIDIGNIDTFDKIMKILTDYQMTLIEQHVQLFINNKIIKEFKVYDIRKDIEGYNKKKHKYCMDLNEYLSNIKIHVKEAKSFNRKSTSINMYYQVHITDELYAIMLLKKTLKEEH